MRRKWLVDQVRLAGVCNLTAAFRLRSDKQFGDTRCPVSECSARSTALPQRLSQEFSVGASLIDELRGEPDVRAIRNRRAVISPSRPRWRTAQRHVTGEPILGTRTLGNDVNVAGPD